MKLTGHKTESVYRRYVIVSTGDLWQGVARVAAHQEAAASKRATTASLAEARARRTGKVPAKSGRLGG